jgi:hypothetical protein
VEKLFLAEKSFLADKAFLAEKPFLAKNSGYFSTSPFPARAFRSICA